MAYPLIATVIPSLIETAACSAVEMRLFRLLFPILSFKVVSRFLMFLFRLGSLNHPRGVKPENSSSSVGLKLGISRMTQVLFT